MSGEYLNLLLPLGCQTEVGGSSSWLHFLLHFYSFKVVCGEHNIGVQIYEKHEPGEMYEYKKCIASVNGKEGGRRWGIS